jgi:hypothetical protein
MTTPAPKWDARRAAAKAEGLKRWTGDPCRNGHKGTRYVSSGECADCCAIRVTGQGALRYQTKREKLRLARRYHRMVKPPEDYAGDPLTIYGAPLRGPNARSLGAVYGAAGDPGKPEALPPLLWPK